MNDGKTQLDANPFSPINLVYFPFTIAVAAGPDVTVLGPERYNKTVGAVGQNEVVDITPVRLRGGTHPTSVLNDPMGALYVPIYWYVRNLDASNDLLAAISPLRTNTALNPKLQTVFNLAAVAGYARPIWTIPPKIAEYLPEKKFVGQQISNAKGSSAEGFQIAQSCNQWALILQGDGGIINASGMVACWQAENYNFS
jgi:hypothetical protein